MESKNKKKMGLSVQIFIALMVGATIGIGIHYLLPDSSFKDKILVNGLLYVIGQGFVRLMQMLVVPMVFCSLVCGSMAIGDTKTLGKVGLKTVAFYLFSTAIAICVALSVASLINPGRGVQLDSVEKTDVAVTQSVGFAETLLNIIPRNPISSMANGDMLPIIVFALFVGVMLAKLGSKVSTVSNFFSVNLMM